MKTQISRDSHRPEKHYSGVYQQQGRMLTDADWNEMVTLINERITQALRDVVGSGVPFERTNGYWPDRYSVPAIAAYAQGLGAANPSEVSYFSQPDFPGAPVFNAPPGIIYADVWERPVLFLEDAGLRDPGLHGADTCARTQVLFQVKHAPSDLQVTDPQRNPQRGSAALSLVRRGQDTEPGGEAASGLGDCLFRLEVHDVKGTPGEPTELTLKWSTENAAEAYANDAQVPQDFKGSDWVYEFYNGTSERHLGVHHVTGPGFPVRGILTAGYPVEPPDGAAWPYVRRWDGWCVLSRNESGVWSLVEGRDRGAELTANNPPVRHGDVVVVTGSVQLLLRELDLELSWNNRLLVAGDYWLVTVREDDAEHVLASDATPAGIIHRYVKLATILEGGMAVQDQLVQFPTLSALTSAGGPTARSGATFIGSGAIEGVPSSLMGNTLHGQLTELLSHVNERLMPAVHTASFQNAVTSGTGGSVTQGDGIVVLRTNAAAFNTSLLLRSNPTSYMMGRHGPGSFLAFRAAFDGVQASGQSAVVMSGSGTAGPDHDSGGFGFRVEHDGTARRLYGVTFGANGGMRASQLLVNNLSDGVHTYKAINRGSSIQFFRDETHLAVVFVEDMVETTVDTYSVSLWSESGQSVEVAIGFLAVGNLRG